MKKVLIVLLYILTWFALNAMTLLVVWIASGFKPIAQIDYGVMGMWGVFGFISVFILFIEIFIVFKNQKNNV